MTPREVVAETATGIAVSAILNFTSRRVWRGRWSSPFSSSQGPRKGAFFVPFFKIVIAKN